MRSAANLFGLYCPGTSVVHRLPVAAKFAGVIAIGIAAVLLRFWWLSVAMLLIAAAVLLLSRVPARRAFGIPIFFLIMVAVVCAYPFFFTSRLVALTTAANIIGSLYLSRVLTLTTPSSELIDALVATTRPLDRLGFSSERFGLAVVLMLRSVPYLMGSFSTVRDAARARGLERRPQTWLTPVVVGAVAYAIRTGEALTARGLGDDDAETDEPAS